MNGDVPGIRLLMIRAGNKVVRRRVLFCRCRRTRRDLQKKGEAMNGPFVPGAASIPNQLCPQVGQF
jgi:hypothetical protein